MTEENTRSKIESMGTEGTELARADAAGGEIVTGRFAELLREVAATKRKSRAKSTLRSYERAWNRFAAWCSTMKRRALPADHATVSAYLEMMKEGHKASTIEFALSVISIVHTKAGFPSPRTDPEVREMRKGLRRAIGTAQRRVDGLLDDSVRLILRSSKGTLTDLRDMAIIAVGFLGALRRSEIVALQVSDCRVTSNGVNVRIGRSKTDQEGKGTVLTLPRGKDPDLCPCVALTRWLSASGITKGPIFRRIRRAECSSRVGDKPLSPASIALIVKSRARSVGLIASVYSGHSMRAGYITSTIKAGRPRDLVKKQSRHKNSDVFDSYVRVADQWNENPGEGLLS